MDRLEGNVIKINLPLNFNPYSDALDVDHFLPIPSLESHTSQARSHS